MPIFVEEASSGIMPELTLVSRGKMHRISRTYMLSLTGDDLTRFEDLAHRYPGGRADLLRDLLRDYTKDTYKWEAPSPDLGHAIDMEASNL